MNRYETVFIMTPVLSDEQTKETVKKFRTYLEEVGAKFHHEESWGMMKLAYPIQKKSTGFYHLFEFEVETDKIKDFEIELIRDERVLRFLTTKMDKHAANWAEKKRKRAAEAQNA